jgi:hypothetical protein
MFLTKRELERFGVEADVTLSQMLSVVVCVLLLDREIVFPKETKEGHQHGRPNDDHIWVLPVDGSAPAHPGKYGRSDGQFLLHGCAA